MILRAPYGVVSADPAWLFNDSGSRIAPSYKGKGRSEIAYEQLDWRVVASMGFWVKKITAPDSILFLWIPNALEVQGVGKAVCRAWNYSPKQLIPWLKVNPDGNPWKGMGHYTRVCTEMLIVATRGRATQLVLRHDIAGVLLDAYPAIVSTRPPAPPGIKYRHSAKPNKSYNLIQKLVKGPYLELFARRRFNDDWDVWGNQAPSGVGEQREEGEITRTGT